MTLGQTFDSRADGRFSVFENVIEEVKILVAQTHDFRRHAAGGAPVTRCIHLVMWAWSAKPVSVAIAHRPSELRVMRSQAARVRNSARKTAGAMPYAAANPRDTVSRANPFDSAHTPISVEAFCARIPASRSGQSFLRPGAEIHSFRRAFCSSRVAALRSFSAARATASTSFKR